MGKKRGFLITFEGIEGCGKSTAVRSIHQYLGNLGRTALLTREPGGTWLGESIREILLNPPDTEDIDLTEEAFLFCASRAAHTRKVIKPALKGGYDIISDRYLDSTFVYQGVAGGLENDELDYLNRIATYGLMPDLTILLDLPVDEGLSRRRGAGAMNRIDKKAITYHSKVRERFLELADMQSDRIKVVDSSGSREMTLKRVKAHVDRLIQQVSDRKKKK
ncbi:dTMP kinase [bacterium]|nr:dTMP kinase [bacterium]